MPTRTLLIDNYDSFTYNLFDLLTRVNGRTPTVAANDIDWDDVDLRRFDNVVISPGPGRPDRARDFGISARVLADGVLPVLGVCLGHQGLCQAFGADVVRAPIPMHGRTSPISHVGEDLFSGLPSPFSAVRYHSLMADRVPDDLELTAWTEDGLVMGVRHRTRLLWGVQFHPESISTEYGADLLANFRALSLNGGRSLRRQAVLAPPGQTAPHTVSAAPPRPRSQTPPRYVVETEPIDRRLNPEMVFEALFGGSARAFWLDGTSAAEADERISVLGDCSGPRAEFVTYDIAAQRVSVERAGRPTEHVPGRFFDYLAAQLSARAVEPVADLPGGFALGYVGYLGYELKGDAGARVVHRSTEPDAAMVFADRAVIIDHVSGLCHLACLSERAGDPESRRWLTDTAAILVELDEYPERHRPAPALPLLRNGEDVRIRLRHGPQDYLRLIGDCLDEISSGESYEVCLTNMATVSQSLDPVSTFGVLRRLSPTPYNALLNFGETAVMSASPERFLKIDRHRVVESKPIKGTRPRGATPEADEFLHAELEASEKDRAENLMIVDLVRNDLSRVCEPGSVHVHRLFDVETYSAVHQLVSTVRGRLEEGRSAIDCVRASFPGGSMTGAPKLRTMEIIDRLEQGPRGVYSGAIGYFSLTGTADLSIVIRTLVAAAGEVRFGIGGAIVALSDPADELEETFVKAVAMRRALAEVADPERTAQR
ncbi:aminodeoxychorismate synthase component I [Rhodococcus sp. D2-41]|uniref:aminodeoxychorismate synthase n=1 Tax=Speluncibacter jeojiensis TaxID=2710754 RepID=A0A9X4M2U7_9ACTN|nr:aminodeoxychorismate synthase component I [Rhodococcus sp. D2-41]MDG3010645.1 aminodeoxychorismate synthase component I [Rhodococcus sp. D2-41]MDG3016824.1 aminodeoxychorismate synthase component I [Corynebacteriales bacterium D3-21]